MRCVPFALFVFVGASVLARSPAPEVIFTSPCECIGFHGIHRWIAKTDLTPVPLDKSAIQPVTPSQIYAWEGGLAADVDLAGMVEARMSSEEKWYALTGRVVDAKVEADGDIHIALGGPPETMSERLAPRFQSAQNGMRFSKKYSVGQRYRIRPISHYRQQPGCVATN